MTEGYQAKSKKWKKDRSAGDTEGTPENDSGKTSARDAPDQLEQGSMLKKRT